MLLALNRRSKVNIASIAYEVSPIDIQATIPVLNHIVPLGPLDVLFANQRPTYVELLLLFSSAIEPAIFIEALSTALVAFPSVCGRRNGTTIEGAQGVRFSAITSFPQDLSSHPPSNTLFDTPNENQVLTLRLSNVVGESIYKAGLGLVFDHALSDVSGPALLLSHISFHYKRLTGSLLKLSPPLPPLPPINSDRQQQSKIQIQPQTSYHHTKMSGECNDGKHRKNQKQKGGVACIEFNYTQAILSNLKTLYGACSRHEAVFTDLVLLLRSAGHTPMSTATISRDDRTRAEIDSLHFGNAIVLVQAELFSDPNTMEIQQDGKEIAHALRSAIQDGVGIDIHSASGYADIHLNTWWHSLQRPMDFGFGVNPTFSIGPRSLAAASQMCIFRDGQANATVIPSPPTAEHQNTTGLTVYFVAPLKVARAVRAIVNKRLLKHQNHSDEQKNTQQQQQKKKKKKKKQKNTKSLPPTPVPGAIVFLHGLGDTSCKWHHRFAPYVRVEEGNFLQPTASVQSVKAHSGNSCASWFDINQLPISFDEPDTPFGLEVAIAKVHGILNRLQAEHIPPSSVVLAGFSQGAALAIQAGLNYPHTLAGIVSISGWLISRNVDIDSMINPSNDEVNELNSVNGVGTRIFFSSGTSDPIVKYDVSKHSCDLLVTALGEDRTVRNVVQRGKHSPKGKEVEAACVFIKKCLLES